MGLLFKTTLIHLKKNSFIVFVLSFFVASGVTVLSSSDNLSSNLNKGFQEINYDSNPHDLILVSKGFKPNQNLRVEPVYENNFANLKLTTKWGYRWSFDSLQDEFWIKKADYNKVADSKFVESGNTTEAEGDLRKLNKTVFSIPSSEQNDYSWANVNLVCYSKVTFFSTADANLHLLDRNRASFHPSKIVEDKDIGVPNTVRKLCIDGTTEDNSLFRSLSFLRAVYDHYKHHIGKNSEGHTETKLDLSQDEIAEAHRSMGAFNPKHFWVANTTSDAYPFMNLLEKDFYFTLESPFKAVMSKNDLAPKFRALVRQMTSPDIYYRLDDSTRSQINEFLNSDLFNNLPVKYWISSLGKMSSAIEAWVPMVPGLTYKETSILLMKLVLWKWLNKSEEFDFFNDDLAKYDEVRKNEIRSLVENWRESEEGISNWDPFSAISEEEDKFTKKPESSEKYFFSTLRANKTISELKLVKLNEDVEKKDNSKQLAYEANDKLISAVKKTFLKWIDGDYYSEDNKNSNTEILAFNRDSYKLKKLYSKENTNIDLFDPDKDIYRSKPDNFGEVYDKVANYIKNSVGSYLNSLFATNIKLAKKFINDSEIFTLSFLLQNFQFDPALTSKYSSRRKYHFWNKSEEEDFNFSIPKLTSKEFNTEEDKGEYAPSINYHKSLVVSNSNKQSAKLNDPSKIGHSYKVISQERKDDAYVNRVKIISGNPLIESKNDYFTILNTFKRDKYEYRDFFKALKKLKYHNPVHTETVHKFANYFLNKFDDKWTDENWISYKDSREWEIIFNFFKSKSNSSSKQGTRVISMIPAEEVINFTRTLPVHSILTTIPTAGYIDQFTSNFAVISPFYAQENNIKPISNEQYEFFKKLIHSDETTQEIWEKEFAAFVMNPANYESIVNINGNKLIVVGTGMSPDMLLPSHSYINLVPNKSKEALVFVDRYGYENIQYNSLSSWDEYYLSLSFPQQIKDLKLEASYQKQISDYISYFLNDKASDANSDLNKDFELKLVKEAPLTQLVYLRSQYVDKFLLATHSMFSLILAFMGMVILFTVWVLIKKYITSSLNTFGVFVANGIYRTKIILNASIFVLLPTLVGVLIGYLLALAIQPIIFGLISSIWYLTPVYSGFSISSLLYYSLIACGILAPLSWISSYFMLKSDVSTLMNVNVTFKHNKLTQWIYKYFNNVSSLWKFRVSVILNTIGRGLILSSATVFLFVFTSFLFNNFNQFKAVSLHEIGSKDYGFSLSFVTPTDQSGQPALVSYTNLGDTYLDRTKHKRDVVVQKSKNRWDLETLEFSESNPEIIGSGLKNIYPVGDIKDYLKQCNDSLSLQEWYERLGLMDFNYPGNALEFNPYNSYLFSNSLTRKVKDGKSIPIDCNKPITEFYDRGNFDFIAPETSDLSLFFSSNNKIDHSSPVDTNSKVKKFKPDVTSANRIQVLGQYVPVENENRKSVEVNGETPWEMTKYGDEPLFKPLIDYYNKKDTLLPKYSFGENNRSYSFLLPEDKEKNEVPLYNNKVKLKGDFVEFNDAHAHPTLQRIFKDHSNYWLFAYHDLHSIRTNPQFLKNRVLMPILFNHDWTFTMFGTMITFNPWQEFSEFFAKYSTELVASMESNYANFINEIIKSRYGEFFVNRFMDRHTSVDKTASHAPGKNYWGKPTWQVTKDMLAPHNRELVEEGLYYINPEKLVYFYEKLRAVEGAKEAATDTVSKHPERFVVFRPDFLYLVYSVIKDKDFLNDVTAPMKVTFHQNIYVPDYGDKYREWKIDGNPVVDARKNIGLTSVDKSVIPLDYEKTPNGDQTYTYLVASIPGVSQTQNIFGLKQDKRGSYLKLRKNGELINYKLYQKKFNDGSYPVIINHFTAKNLNLGVGSTIEIDIHNTTDRFTKKMKEIEDKKKVVFRVVDIYDSYYKNAFYLSQEHANEIIGLDPNYGYNGIYTKKFTSINDLPLQFVKAISGYSPSGIYSRQKISKFSSEFTEFLNGTPSNMHTSKYEPDIKFLQPKNSTWLKLRLGLRDVDSIEGTDDIADVLDRVFGGSYALSPSIVHIENANLFNDFVFNTVSDLVISVINLFIAIFTPLLVFALLVITNLIIEDLKNLLTILNLLGFTYAENSATILLYLGLVLGFSTIIALPISSVLLSLYVEGVFDTLSIYLPIYLRFDYAVLSFVLLTGMFGFSYWRSRRKIKSLYLPIAMKSLNE